MSAETVLTTTRSVRRRLDLDRPVGLALVRECLEIALQAPSGSNAQRWHFVVVTDPGQRAAVGAVYHRACEEYLRSPGAAGTLFADDPDRSRVQKRVHASVEHLATTMGRVPVLVIPCLRLSGGALPAGNQAGIWGSLLPAAWSYMLAARTRGLGTAWTTLHLTYEREVAEILGLPDDVHQGALIPTAYYTGQGFKPAPRQSVDEVLHVDRWS
ncbi:MAG: nitroreductase family protein [Kutzneria sp.]|nr:nitroreductase family protein [Kutzneria sp.]MBV9846977.1 nitroreductase family protein [Kutzneria sp.]